MSKKEENLKSFTVLLKFGKTNRNAYIPVKRLTFKNLVDILPHANAVGEYYLSIFNEVFSHDQGEINPNNFTDMFESMQARQVGMSVDQYSKYYRLLCVFTANLIDIDSSEMERHIDIREGVEALLNCNDSDDLPVFWENQFTEHLEEALNSFRRLSKTSKIRV